MTDLEKLKKTFDEVDIFYIEQVDKTEYKYLPAADRIILYIVGKHVADHYKSTGEFSDANRRFFEFENGKLMGY